MLEILNAIISNIYVFILYVIKGLIYFICIEFYFYYSFNFNHFDVCELSNEMTLTFLKT